MTSRQDTGSEDSVALAVPVAAVAIAAFAFAFQETSILPALARIQGRLPGATTSTVTFLESGYLAVAAVSAPTLGKIGDRRGKKPVIVAAMLCYLVGAVGAALTPNFAVLVIFRALQGVGGAIFALSIAVMRNIAGDRLAVAIGGIVSGFAVGITAGFAASGVITATLGWRWLFGLETMLIMLGIVFVLRFLPDVGERSEVNRDLQGSLLLGLGIGSLLLALTFGPSMGWQSWQVLLLLAVFSPLLVGWYQREKRIDEPLLDVGVLRSRNILFPNLAGAMAGYAAFSTYLLVPRLAVMPQRVPGLPWLDVGLGLSLTAVGLLMMPIGLGTLVGASSGGVLSRRFGGKWTFVVGMAILAAGPGLLATYRPNLAVIGLWLFITGAGFGSSVGAAGTFVTQAAPEGSTGVAMSLNSLARLTGGGIGAQVGTNILIISRVPDANLSQAWGYAVAFGVAAGVAAVGAFLASLTTSERG